MNASPPPPSEPGPRILLVEDDPVIREATLESLGRLGFLGTGAADGVSGLAAFRDGAPDVVVTDVVLPELDGVSLARLIREQSTVPILMISARGDDIDVIAGLEAGADDYLTKPFKVNVLAARLRALMRRAALRPPSSPPSSPGPGFALGPVPTPGRSEPGLRRVGDLEVCLNTMEVRVSGATLAVTPTEFRLLAELTSSPGVVFTRESLLKNVWDYAWGGDTRVVDVHIQRLRGKVGSGRIVTARGFGYKIVG